ncbi:major facilitator superfamily domain-containing protein [Mycotypha africana]|uniref:major facilitator superfamily domain-containing protein n=1 Tax=Mycotypha africana TaxID=64632 RepID=UPI0023012345|nr:major facilitator superfamily domain-containing protein [Mycotypha africana]KAI8969238.1 major facilitator superfamily domain-containing protein [Mycotypha africana]
MVQYLLPKLLYVCLYGVLGSAIPYLSIFYAEKLHLQSQQIGIILAIAPFVQSLACPFWTMQVDKRPHRHGAFMAALMLIGGLSIVAMMFIPILFGGGDGGRPSSILAITISLAISFAFFGQPVTVLVDSAVLKILGDNAIYYGDQRLWGSVSNGVNILVVGYVIGQLGINYAFYIFAISVTCFIITALCTTVTTSDGSNVTNADTEREPLLNAAHNNNNKQMRGYYAADPTVDNFINEIERMNSTASSRANTILVEGDQNLLALQRTTTSIAVRDVQDEASLVMEHMDSLPPLGLALSQIPTVDSSLAAFATVVEATTEEELAVKTLGSTIFGSVQVWTFLITALCFGLLYSMVAQFLFLFFKQDLGLNASVMGWTGPLGGVTEVATFYFSRALLKKFDVSTLLTCSHLTIVVRNLAYKALVPNESATLWFALALQLLSGFAFALTWSTCVSEVDQMFPDHQRAIAQGVLAALFSGLGYGFGSILGGYVFDNYGAQSLFDASITISLVSLVIFWLGRIKRVSS